MTNLIDQLIDFLLVTFRSDNLMEMRTVHNILIKLLIRTIFTAILLLSCSLKVNNGIWYIFSTKLLYYWCLYLRSNRIAHVINNKVAIILLTYFTERTLDVVRYWLLHPRAVEYLHV